MVITNKAIKSLKKLPKIWCKRIEDKIELLSKDPYAPSNNVKKLKNTDFYRLRVGDYRVVYEIKDEVVTIIIIKIKSRGSIYK